MPVTKEGPLSMAKLLTSVRSNAKTYGVVILPDFIIQ